MESNIVKAKVIGHQEILDFLGLLFYEFYDKRLKTDSRSFRIIKKLIDELDEGFYFLVEYPYVEKYYRDIYYNYLSTKHNPYSRNSIRVNIFSKEIDYDDFENCSISSDCFLGYFTIRPTSPYIIGHSYISPKAFSKNKTNNIATYIKRSIIEGVRLVSPAFPYSNQDGEFMTCAETSLSLILNYFGAKYSNYNSLLPSTILTLLLDHSDQRQTPSSGLHFEQISHILNKVGFGPVLYMKEVFGKEFNSLISIYIDSKIPIIAGISSKDENFNHSVVIIGQQNIQEIDYTNLNKLITQGKQNKYVFLDELRRKFIANDDNLPPYSIIDLDKPTSNYPPNKTYTDTEIFTFVVPLYKKIYRDADKAKYTIKKLLENKKVGYKFKSDIIIRVLLTSSSSFKNYIRNLKDFNKNIELFILQTHMPKFIWLAEIYDARTFPQNLEAKAIIVSDSTDPIEDLDIEDVLFFACYPDKTIVMDSEYDINFDMFENEENNDAELNKDDDSSNSGQLFATNTIKNEMELEKIIVLDDNFNNYTYYSNYK